MMKRITLNSRSICFIAMAICINIVGGFLALSLKLPIYLDTIGTVFSALIMGPIGGACVGALTALINGMAFDPTSLYFMPVQLIVVGLHLLGRAWWLPS